MVSVNDVQKWFEELRYANWKDNVDVKEDSANGCLGQPSKFSLRFNVYTDNNKYRISAQYDASKNLSYLGCIAESRKPRAGEENCRGNDLPDGKLNKETWNRILGAIVGYELVKVHKEKSVNSPQIVHTTKQRKVNKAKSIVEHWDKNHLFPSTLEPIVPKIKLTPEDLAKHWAEGEKRNVAGGLQPSGPLI